MSKNNIGERKPPFEIPHNIHFLNFSIMKNSTIAIQQPQPRYKVVVSGRVFIGTEEEVRRFLTEMREA